MRFGGLFGSQRNQMMMPRQSQMMQGDPRSIPPQQQMPAMPQQQQERPGLGTRLLGEGWEGKAAALGSAMMGNANAIPQYHQRQQQEALFQRQQQMAAQQAQQERMADREDFMFEHDYRRNNPAPQAPDTFERALIGAGIDPDSPEAQQMYRDRAQSMTRNPNDEFVVVPIPGVGTYAGPRSGLGEAMGQNAPARPVGNLRPVQQGGSGGNAGGGF